MALPKFPSLGDEIKSELNKDSKERKLRVDESLRKLPKLEMPELDELDSEYLEGEDLDYKDLPDSIPEIEEIYEPLNEIADEDDLELEAEDEDSEENFGNEDSEIEADNEEDFVEDEEDDGDFQITDEENDEILDEVSGSESLPIEDYADEYEGNEEFPLLIGIDDYKDESPLLSEMHEDKRNKNPKELDDEKARLYFKNLKDKIAKLINKKDKPIKKSKSKSNKPIKVKKSVNLKKILIVTIVLLILSALIYFIVNKYNNSFVPIEELTVSMNEDDLMFEMSNFSLNNESIEFTIENQADISSDFFLDVIFKSKMPFFGEKYSCTSEIIALEPGMSLTENLVCNEAVNKDIDYKLSIDVSLMP